MLIILVYLHFLPLSIALIYSSHVFSSGHFLVTCMASFISYWNPDEVTIIDDNTNLYIAIMWPMENSFVIPKICFPIFCSQNLCRTHLSDRDFLNVFRYLCGTCEICCSSLFTKSSQIAVQFVYRLKLYNRYHSTLGWVCCPTVQMR